jgi:hypothetical protein
MSNHTAQLEEFALMLSKDTTPDRARTIGKYAVSVQTRQSRGVPVMHWKVDGHHISFLQLLVLMMNEDEDTPDPAYIESGISTPRSKGRRAPVDVINAIRRGDATPMMGRAPVAVVAEFRDALKVALRAIDLAAVDLGLALTHRPNAGKPEAWINYAVATIERDARNSDDATVAVASPTGDKQ